MNRADVTSAFEESRPVVALAGGIGAFTAGFLAFFALVAGTGNVSFSSPARVLTEIGHLFYNSFNVPAYTRQTFVAEQNGTVVRETIRETWQNGITGWTRISQVTHVGGEVVDTATNTTTVPVDSSLPPEVYLLVPVAAVLVAGLAVGYLAADGTVDRQTLTLRSLLAGGIMTVGFLLVALLGTYVLVLEGTQAIRYPARLETLLYGFAYPAVGGTLGVAAGQFLGAGAGDQGDERRDDEADGTDRESRVSDTDERNGE